VRWKDFETYETFRSLFNRVASLSLYHGSGSIVNLKGSSVSL